MTHNIAQPGTSSEDAVAASAEDEARWLVAEQARLEGLIHALMGHGSAGPGGVGSSAELSTAGQHPADSGTETFMREVDLTMLADLRAELDQVLRVRRRLAEGAPLLCEVCHQPIPAERLEAIPAARFCVLHEERFELGGFHLSDLASSSPTGTRPAAGRFEGGESDESDPAEEMLATENELPAEAIDDASGPEEAAISTTDGEALRVEELEAELSADGLLEDEMGEALVDLDVSTEDIESSLEELTLASSEREWDEQLEDQREEGELEIDELDAGADGDVRADLGSLVDRQLGLASDQPEPGADAGEESFGDARETGEFVCGDCFLLKPASQLADPAHQRCVDCVSVTGG